MAGIYDGDKTFVDWGREVGNKGHQLRQNLTDQAEQKTDWDGFKGTRSKTKVAVDLGRTSGAGTAQAGAATTVTLAVTDTQPDDFYIGHTIEIMSGTGVGQTKTIDDYVASTKVATVNSAWTTNPDATSVYAIQTDIDELESAINNGYKLKRVAFGDTTQTPSKDLFLNIRKFT